MRLLVISLLAVLLVPRSSVPPGDPTPEQLRAWDVFLAARPRPFEIRWGKRMGTPAGIRRRGEPPARPRERISEETAADSATRFMEENAGLFAIRPGIDAFRVDTVEWHGGGWDVWIRQTYRGAPVEGGRYWLRIARDGDFDELRGSWVRDVDRERCAWLDPREAERIARDALPEVQWELVETTVLGKPSGPARERVYFIKAHSWGGYWSVTVNPCSGEVVEKNWTRSVTLTTTR